MMESAATRMLLCAEFTMDLPSYSLHVKQPREKLFQLNEAESSEQREGGAVKP